MMIDDRAVLILASVIKIQHSVSDHEAFTAARAWFNAVDASREVAHEHLKIA